jgi:hypothetical protein
MSNDITKSEDAEYTLETLPPLLPQQQAMLGFILNGDNYTDAYKKAGYRSVDHAQKAAFILVTRNPLKAHLEYFAQELSKLITPAYIANKLNAITEKVLDESNPLRFNPDTAIKALAEVNKMRGNYAPTNVNVQSVSASIEDIRRAREEYKKDY